MNTSNQEATMTAQREMPQYQSHKKVWALKIKQVELRPANGHLIHPADDGYAPFEVSDEYVQKHNPQAGGYFVVYEDGYQSWSPAAAFESGYTTAKLNTGQPAIKGYRNLSQAEIDLMNEIKEAGEQLRHLVTRVQSHINSQPAPEVPHSQVTNPARWAALAQTDLQTGLMALTRAVAQPTSF